MPAPSGLSAPLSRKIGIAIALILGASAVGLQMQAMNGYTKIWSEPRFAPIPKPAAIPSKPSPEVCKTKEDCVDCKKRPEAPDWWTDKKEV
jgi:hypothetical protein